MDLRLQKSARFILELVFKLVYNIHCYFLKNVKLDHDLEIKNT